MAQASFAETELCVVCLMDEAIEAVRGLSPVAQDEIARAMLTLAGGEETEDIDPAHLADVLASLAQAQRREVVSAADIEAVFRNFEA